MIKIKTITFLFITIILLSGYNTDISENYSFDPDILNIMPVFQEPNLTKDKSTHMLKVQGIKFKDEGIILDPEFKMGITIERVTSNISNVICGFNYKNHLYVIDYYYNYKDLDMESNFEKVIILLKDYYGKPYHEEKDFHKSSLATIIYPHITWIGQKERWTVNLISIKKNRDEFLIHLKYSSWPKGDRLKQWLPDNNPRNDFP